MSRSRRIAAPPRWALQDAKNKLSEVVDAASRGQPQVVTRRGVATAVVISYDEYERISRSRERLPPSLAEYLLEMPRAAGATGEIERIALNVRDADL